MAIWSPRVWAPAAVVAILLLATGVDEPWVIVLVFPVVPFVLAVLRGRTAKTGSIVGEGAVWIASIAAPALALAVVVVAAPDSGISMAVTNNREVK